MDILEIAICVAVVLVAVWLGSCIAENRFVGLSWVFGEDMKHRLIAILSPREYTWVERKLALCQLASMSTSTFMLVSPWTWHQSMLGFEIESHRLFLGLGWSGVMWLWWFLWLWAPTPPGVHPVKTEYLIPSWLLVGFCLVVLCLIPDTREPVSWLCYWMACSIPAGLVMSKTVRVLRAALVAFLTKRTA